jgi:hypothetical protein
MSLDKAEILCLSIAIAVPAVLDSTGPQKNNSTTDLEISIKTQHA